MRNIWIRFILAVQGYSKLRARISLRKSGLDITDELVQERVEHEEAVYRSADSANKKDKKRIAEIRATACQITEEDVGNAFDRNEEVRPNLQGDQELNT
jgi:hypothetical protein